MAISTSITWDIESVDRELSDNFIIGARYKIIGVATVTSGAGSTITTTYGPIQQSETITFGTSRTGSETPYNSVTKDDVITWCKNEIGITTVGVGTGSNMVMKTGVEIQEDMLRTELNIVINEIGTGGVEPTTADGTPW